MNSRQLRWILSNDKVTSRTFRDVFALDEIVHIKQKSFPLHTFLIWIRVTSLVVTGLQSTLIGKRRPEYFDSFGRPPTREIKDFLYTCAESWKYNHVPVQEFYSTTCGQFVVFYIYQRCSGLTLEAIIRKYFNPHAKLRNDVLVRDFVKMHYQLSAKVMDPNFISRVAKEIDF